jgi:hypothetical protein
VLELSGRPHQEAMQAWCFWRRLGWIQRFRVLDLDVGIAINVRQSSKSYRLLTLFAQKL